MGLKIVLIGKCNIYSPHEKRARSNLAYLTYVMKCLIIPETDGGEHTWMTDDWVIDEETCQEIWALTNHEGGLSDNDSHLPTHPVGDEILPTDEVSRMLSSSVARVCMCECVCVCVCVCRYNIIIQPTIVLNLCFASFLRHYLFCNGSTVSNPEPTHYYFYSILIP